MFETLALSSAPCQLACQSRNPEYVTMTADCHLISWRTSSFNGTSELLAFFKRSCFLIVSCMFVCITTESFCLLLYDCIRVWASPLYRGSEGWKADKALVSIQPRNVSTWQWEILAERQRQTSPVNCGYVEESMSSQHHPAKAHSVPEN